MKVNGCTKLSAIFGFVALFLPVEALSQEQQQPFFEAFDKLDEGRWYVSDGWSNGPHQNCVWLRDRAQVAGGQLELSLTTDGTDDFALSCAEVQSTARYGFGTYEARMRVPYATGMNANFFTFIGPPQNKPHNEIDFEFLNRTNPVLQTNYYLGGDHENEDLVPLEDDREFHIYSMTWHPDSIRWYIDGQLIREAEGAALPNIPQKIYLSLWSTDQLTDWMGHFDPTSAPQTMYVDWVAFTPAGSACQFEASILCADPALD